MVDEVYSSLFSPDPATRTRAAQALSSGDIFSGAVAGGASVQEAIGLARVSSQTRFEQLGRAAQQPPPPVSADQAQQIAQEQGLPPEISERFSAYASQRGLGPGEARFEAAQIRDAATAAAGITGGLIARAGGGDPVAQRELRERLGAESALRERIGGSPLAAVAFVPQALRQGIQATRDILGPTSQEFQSRVSALSGQTGAPVQTPREFRGVERQFTGPGGARFTESLLTSEPQRLQAFQREKPPGPPAYIATARPEFGPDLFETQARYRSEQGTLFTEQIIGRRPTVEKAIEAFGFTPREAGPVETEVARTLGGFPGLIEVPEALRRLPRSEDIGRARFTTGPGEGQELIRRQTPQGEEVLGLIGPAEARERTVLAGQKFTALEKSTGFAARGITGFEARGVYEPVGAREFEKEIGLGGISTSARAASGFFSPLALGALGIGVGYERLFRGQQVLTPEERTKAAEAAIQSLPYAVLLGLGVGAAGGATRGQATLRDARAVTLGEGRPAPGVSPVGARPGVVAQIPELAVLVTRIEQRPAQARFGLVPPEAAPRVTPTAPTGVTGQLLGARVLEIARGRAEARTLAARLTPAEPGPVGVVTERLFEVQPRRQFGLREQFELPVEARGGPPVEATTAARTGPAGTRLFEQRQLGEEFRNLIIPRGGTVAPGFAGLFEAAGRRARVETETGIRLESIRRIERGRIRELKAQEQTQPGVLAVVFETQRGDFFLARYREGVIPTGRRGAEIPLEQRFRRLGVEAPPGPDILTIGRERPPSATPGGLELIRPFEQRRVGGRILERGLAPFAVLTRQEGKATRQAPLAGEIDIRIATSKRTAQFGPFEVQSGAPLPGAPGGFGPLSTRPIQAGAPERVLKAGVRLETLGRQAPLLYTGEAPGAPRARRPGLFAPLAPPSSVGLSTLEELEEGVEQRRASRTEARALTLPISTGFIRGLIGRPIPGTTISTRREARPREVTAAAQRVVPSLGQTTRTIPGIGSLQVPGVKLGLREATAQKSRQLQQELLAPTPVTPAPILKPLEPPPETTTPRVPLLFGELPGGDITGFGDAFGPGGRRKSKKRTVPEAGPLALQVTELITGRKATQPPDVPEIRRQYQRLSRERGILLEFPTVEQIKGEVPRSALVPEVQLKGEPRGRERPSILKSPGLKRGDLTRGRGFSKLLGRLRI